MSDETPILPPHPKDRPVDPETGDPVMTPEEHEAALDIWWPNMGESRGILASYVDQFDLGEDDDDEVPEDPDPGDES